MDIIIRQIVKADIDELNKFYIQALEKEYKTLVSKEDIQELLRDFNQNKWIDHYWEDPDMKAFIAVDTTNTIIGFLTAKYFDSKDSIIFSLTTLPDEFRNIVRDIFLKRLLEEFPLIKNMFVDVYEGNVEEIDFFIRRGFKVWDTSTVPVGKQELNINLMQKVLK